jgi:MOSC domain-containing protein
MARRQIGTVMELFRYPVKSMLGERLERIEVGAQGVIGDRAWALRESANGKVVSAKKFAHMLDLRATYESPPRADDRDDEPAPIKIQLPDGRALHAADADAAAILSAVLGREVVIERAIASQHTRAGIDTGSIFGDVPIENVMPQLTAATMPDTYSLMNGSFFDSATMHVLATGTLAHMRSLVGEGAQLDARRFRPNIVVDTGAAAKGFVEDEWLGQTLEVGGSANGDSVKIVAMRPALRCVMTTHRQEDLGRDLRIIRAAAQFHKATLGVFASVGAPGTVRVGDPVYLTA